MRFLLVALVLFGLFLFLRWQYQQSPRRLYQWLAGLAGIGLIAMVLTGRAHWIVAVVGGILPFLGKAAILLRWLPFLSWARRSFGSSAIHLQTAWLDLTIDRRTGAMDGTIRQGEFAGQKLSQLSLSQLEKLLQACASDLQSAALLRAYLQRTQAGWQAGEAPEAAVRTISRKPPCQRKQPLRSWAYPFKLRNPKFAQRTVPLRKSFTRTEVETTI